MSVDELSDRFLQFMLNEYPEFATYKGFRLQEDKLDIIDLDLYRRREEFCKKLHDDCLKVKENELSRSDNTTLAILKHISSTVPDGIQFGNHLMCSNFYEGPDIHFSKYAMVYMNLRTEVDYNNYICRLRSIPQQVDGGLKLLREGLKRGIIPIKDSMMRFFSRLKEMPSEIPHKKCEEIRQEAISIIRNQIQPSFKDFLTFLKQDYFPNLTRKTIGIDSLPDHPLRYESNLRFHCDVDWSQAKIHQLGLDMVQKYKDRILQIMAAHQFEGSMVEFSSYLSSQPGFGFDQAEDIGPYCQKVINDRILPRLPQMFHMPNETPLVFIDEHVASPARAVYNGPPLDNSKPAQVVLDVSNPKSFSKHEVMVLMLHETSPGHHFETCAMSMNDKLPTFRRLKDDRTYFDAPGRYLMNSAYTEGWGLYCESLGEELGLYENQLEEYWYLTYNIVRCARAVTDTGIHHLGWSKEDAVRYFDENVPLIPQRRDMEILRYITFPGLDPSYMVGFLNIKQMRNRAMEKLGPLFDIRDFHQLILSEGKVPLGVLETMVDGFIEQTLVAKKL